MKIAILTHRLGHNYGGSLQAYVLNSVISSMMPEASVVTYNAHPVKKKMILRMKATVGRTLKYRRLYISSQAIEDYLNSSIQDFGTKYIGIADGDFDPALVDLLVVGSDQVWRAAYVDPISYMFGDVIDDSVKRISYAASFGTDDLSEYTQSQIERTSELAKKFSAISVREASGVDIVKRYWNIEAHQHVDPTLLLSTSDYSRLIDDGNTEPLRGSLFVYVLDQSEKNVQIVNEVENLTATKQFNLIPKEYKSFLAFMKNRKAYLMPKVEQWLRGFRDADYVVTDSFHGTVFSIIFNKPFISIGNKGRGIARFSSILKLFGLEDRLVLEASDLTYELLMKKIDWKTVNDIKKRERVRSIEYLKKNLEVK
jgi:hypothetical protein